MLRIMSSRRSRHFVLFLADMFCLVLACALIIGVYPSSAMALTTRAKVTNSALLIACILLVRLLLGSYAQSWRYANESSYLLFVLADALGGAVFLAASDMFLVYKISVIHTLAALSVELLFTLTTRFVYQWHRAAGHNHKKALRRQAALPPDARAKTRVAIVGASDMGVQLAQELLSDRGAKYVPVCFIDKNREKVGNYIYKLKVYPEDEHVGLLAERLSIDTFVIAVPDKGPGFLQQLFEFYKQFGLRVLVYDYPANRMLQDGGEKTIREINIEDLLPREKIETLGEGQAAFYRGLRILVTGAGGSIGSELCRQLYRMEPSRLVLLDIYENGVYDLCQELQAVSQNTELHIEIGSVRDARRLDEVMEAHKPDVVFHAAAHKHVPLMEHNPTEAVKNNVLGTLNVVNAAEKHGVRRFILISTDKAVNPTNVMGATKRLCEMIVQSRKDSPTDFVAVRFGNVLNSNGSVIPLFKRQIAQGGPITLTDKRVVRYFMMIPEAAQLVLQTGCFAEKGDIYVLNMGQPVRILDLAENMIRLSGLAPYADIDIVEVGLRPGEKLYEELLVREETMRQTGDSRIFIEHETGPDRAEVEKKLTALTLALDEGTPEALRAALRHTVPTYQDAEETNLMAEEAIRRQEQVPAPGGISSQEEAHAQR
ncbi:MAG TPA: nucleoside-diphosphate sugar epimerase/dehydratase [Candidatus Limnocylindria bacterium]|nr:nucleoside-diphosphate sugar epimerase/dehydratase [Candidatus Limnocylindria bacterium]